MLQIDWESTFYCLRGENGFLYTDLMENKRRRQKIHFLIEEISTIKQLKKSLYNVYKNRLCSFCELNKEDFDHVWICPEKREHMNSLVINTKKILEEMIIESRDVIIN
jgi:hypothetical protein